MSLTIGAGPNHELRDRLQHALGSVYAIERELGGGGMSHVFLAREVLLDRRVVVKLLPPELAAGVSVDRFRHEIQVAAKLQHPHIVPILAAGEMSGIPYYTMPLIEGESLRARITRGGRSTVLDVLHILHDVIDALAYAHERGVVHRDIKPENVLMSGRHAMVTDFGVAKALSAADSGVGVSDPEIGFAIGTPAYMSPEQAAADPDIDHRADIYAFGVLAYELLAGRPPFVGRAPYELLAAHVARAPVPIEELRPDVPPSLAALIMRCLEKRPVDRFASAAEIRDAVDALLTRRAGTIAPALLRRRELPALLAAAAAVLIVAASSLVVRASPPATDPAELAWTNPTLEFLHSSHSLTESPPTLEALPAPPEVAGSEPAPPSVTPEAPRSTQRPLAPVRATERPRRARAARIARNENQGRSRPADATFDVDYGHALRIALMAGDTATVSRFQRNASNPDSLAKMADSLRRHVMVLALAHRQRSASPAPQPPPPPRRSTPSEEMDWPAERLENPEKRSAPEPSEHRAAPRPSSGDRSDLESGASL